MKGLWRRTVVAGLALGLDLVGYGLPTRYKPRTAATGVRGWLGQRLNVGRKDGTAAGIMMGGAVGSALIGRSIETWCRRLPQGLDTLGEALFLSSLLDVQALRSGAQAVANALDQGDAQSARAAWNACPILAPISCAALSEEEMAQIATSRVATMAHTRGIAPLLYYVVGGLPAALVFDWLMLDIGMGANSRFARHLRSIAGGVSARGSALLMAVAGELQGADGLAAETLLHSEGGLLHTKPDDLNALSMAGALDVTLTGPSGRIVNGGKRSPDAADLRRAGSIAGMSIGLAGALLLITGLAWRIFGPRSRRDA